MLEWFLENYFKRCFFNLKYYYLEEKYYFIQPYLNYKNETKNCVPPAYNFDTELQLGNYLDSLLQTHSNPSGRTNSRLRAI